MAASLAPADRAVGAVLGQSGGLRRIQLAVELRLQQQQLAAIAGAHRFASAAAARANVRRARHRRDITVPIGDRSHLRDVAIRELLQLPQNERLAQLHRQRRDQGIDPRPLVGPQECRLGIVRRVGDVLDRRRPRRPARPRARAVRALSAP